MKKTLITRENVSEKVEHFTAQHLSLERAPIIGIGWEDIVIEEGFRDSSFHQITEIIGGTAKTKKIVLFRLRNEPFHHWSAQRFSFNVTSQEWEYTAGQSEDQELKAIRKDLSK